MRLGNMTSMLTMEAGSFIRDAVPASPRKLPVAARENHGSETCEGTPLVKEGESGRGAQVTRRLTSPARTGLDTLTEGSIDRAAFDRVDAALAMLENGLPL
jgi:hypothetical protein